MAKGDRGGGWLRLFHSAEEKYHGDPKKYAEEIGALEAPGAAKRLAARIKKWKQRQANPTIIEKAIQAGRKRRRAFGGD